MTGQRFPEKAMALIAWMDVFERMDTLMLEIRHIQETIASQLDAPILYKVFAFEDAYLWGRYSTKDGPVDWTTKIGGLSARRRDCDALAQECCPLFPALKPAGWPRQDETGGGAGDELGIELRNWRSDFLKQGAFSAIEERLYEALCYLQESKRETLADKLFLASHGYDAFHGDRADSDALLRFMLMRRAALAVLHERLDAFRDTQSSVQEVLNLSLERDPVPTVRRRRDQGIYTSHLSDVCWYLAKDIGDYFSFLNGGAHPEGYSCDETDIELLIHRYTGYFTSQARADKRQPSNARGGHRRGQSLRAGFVRSSYWMPDRPDLQPILAHELAHLMIEAEYHGLEPIELDGSHDPLARLLRKLALAFEFYGPQFRFLDFGWRARLGLLDECAVDLISVAVQGPSYLFASFLELFGLHCDALARSGPSEILQAVDSERITAIRDALPGWHLRLMITVTCVEKLLEGRTQPGELTTTLIDGIRSLVEKSRALLESWMDGDQREDWQTWHVMTNAIIEEIACSPLITQTRAWTDATDEYLALWQKAKFPPPDRHRSPLPEQAAAHCLGAWLDRLVEAPRLLGQTLIETAVADRATIVAQFRDLYLSGSPTESLLFARLVDIPWQCAVLTARDFLGDDANSRRTRIDPNTWITAMHELNWLGRDLYQAALEFVVWYERSPVTRFKAVVRWLRQLSLEIAGRSGANALEGALKIINEGVRQALDGGSSDITASLAALGWPPTPSRSAPEVTADALSDAIDERPEIRNGNERAQSERRRHQIEYLASGKMDATLKTLTAALGEASKLLSGSRVSNPDENPDKLEQSDQADHPFTVLAMRDLGRIVHYLAIRPESRPGGKPTKHHAAATHWNDVFFNYLDVPCQPRKRWNDAIIPGLVPSRSFRIDRLSLEYSPDVSSERRPPPEVNQTREASRILFWRPWGEEGHFSPADNRHYQTYFLSVPLLGRFDRFVLDESKHTARPAANNVDPVPYYRRQQIGFPFACNRDNKTVEALSSYSRTPPFPKLAARAAGQYSPIEYSNIPIATINILLTQRSARLTFIERLMNEPKVLGAFNIASSFEHFDPKTDIGLLTDGWGDVFLVLFATVPPVVADGKTDSFGSYWDTLQQVQGRLQQVIDLRRALFRDPLVVRSETSYSPVAFDAAVISPKTYSCTMSVRFKSSRHRNAMLDSVEQQVKETLVRNSGLKPLFERTRVSGRLDYTIATSRNASGVQQAIRQLLDGTSWLHGGAAYGVIYEALRSNFFGELRQIGSTSSTISEYEGHRDANGT